MIEPIRTDEGADRLILTFLVAEDRNFYNHATNSRCRNISPVRHARLLDNLAVGGTAFARAIGRGASARRGQPEEIFESRIAPVLGQHGRPHLPIRSMIRRCGSTLPARTIVRISAAGALAGAVYSRIAHNDAFAGAVIGGVNGAAIPWLEITLRGPAGVSLRRLPFLGALTLRSALYLAVIVLINAVFVPLVNGFDWMGVLESRDIVFAAAATVVGNLLLGVEDLLGRGVLFAFVPGRYHHPRLEERALLFVDLRASTATAERLGGARFLAFLNAVFADLSAAIVEHGGEIHKYVGDEIIATWRLGPGSNDARIVRAWASARARLSARADRYMREFGLVPDFRAALHAGEVVVGELGTLKKEIALIGDPMNTAARILEACRDLDCPALASSTLLRRLDRLPASIAPRAIAPLPLWGKSEPLELFALERHDAFEPANSEAG